MIKNLGREFLIVIFFLFGQLKCSFCFLDDEVFLLCKKYKSNSVTKLTQHLSSDWSDLNHRKCFN